MTTLQQAWDDIEDWMQVHDAILAAKAGPEAQATLQIVLDAMLEEIAEAARTDQWVRASKPVVPLLSAPPSLPGTPVTDEQLLRQWLVRHR